MIKNIESLLLGNVKLRTELQHHVPRLVPRADDMLVATVKQIIDARYPKAEFEAACVSQDKLEVKTKTKGFVIPAVLPSTFNTVSRIALMLDKELVTGVTGNTAYGRPNEFYKLMFNEQNAQLKHSLVYWGELSAEGELSPFCRVAESDTGVRLPVISPVEVARSFFYDFRRDYDLPNGVALAALLVEIISELLYSDIPGFTLKVYKGGSFQYSYNGTALHAPFKLN